MVLMGGGGGPVHAWSTMLWLGMGAGFNKINLVIHHAAPCCSRVTLVVSRALPSLRRTVFVGAVAFALEAVLHALDRGQLLQEPQHHCSHVAHWC